MVMAMKKTYFDPATGETKERKEGQGPGLGGSWPAYGSKNGIANRSKNRPWREAIDRAIAQSDGKKLRALAEALINKALEGDVGALREIGDRLDGKSIQQVEAEVETRIIISVDDKNL